MANESNLTASEIIRPILDTQIWSKLAHDDRLLAIMQAGRLINVFAWHGQQAWLIGSTRQYKAALDALDRLACAALSLVSGENREALLRFIRFQQAAFRDRLESEAFLDERYAVTEWLNELVAGQPTDPGLLLVRERQEFLGSFNRQVEELEVAIGQHLSGAEKDAFVLGKRIDECIRPSHEICRWIYSIMPVDQNTGTQKTDLEPLLPMAASKAASNPQVPIDRLQETEKYACPWPPQRDPLLGNRVIQADELPIPTGWALEIQSRWRKLYDEKIKPLPDLSERMARLVHQFNVWLKTQESAQKTYEFPGHPSVQIGVDEAARTVVQGTRTIEFKKKKIPFDLFTAALKNLGTPCKAEELMQAVWGSSGESARNRFDATKTKLNKLLAGIGIELGQRDGLGYTLMTVSDTTPGRSEPAAGPVDTTVKEEIRQNQEENKNDESCN